jgi:hypothetical protein
MKLKVIKIAFEENQEIDLFQYINPHQNEIINSSSQIVIEHNISYIYITIYYKASIYNELQKTETHKENLKKEITNLIREKYPTNIKVIHQIDYIVDNYKRIKKIYDFKIVKNFGETTINKEKHILENVLQIIKKYQLEL